MPSKSSSEVRIVYLLFDKSHRDELRPRTIVVAAEAFMNMQVSLFLGITENQHRLECENGLCSRCPGAILVKCAWLVKIPVATAEETTRQITELEHDPSQGLEFMLAHRYMSQYIKTHEEDTIRVLLECTFDKEDKWYNDLKRLSPSKHSRSLSDSDDAAHHADDNASKRPKLVVPEPKGLGVIPSSTDPSGTAPIHILPPTQALFPFYIQCDGIVIVDKTRFIVVIDNLLNKHTGCIIALPKGIGKTALKTMMAAWYNCHIDQDTFMQLFAHLDICRISMKQREDGTAPKTMWSLRQCPCMLFDLSQIEQTTGGEEVSLSINQYVCRTIQDFVREYSDKLGDEIVFSPEEEKSPPKMLEIIASRLSNSKIFICVDHWDAPIQASLPSPDGGATLIAITLTKFMAELTAAHLSDKIKLLIIGNMPLFQTPGEGLQVFDSIKDISILRDMDGAFEMNHQELKDFFSVLSHGRRVQLTTEEPGLRHKLGAFSPPSLASRPDDDPPTDIYNFNLVLHYVTITLGFYNLHRTLTTSPLLGALSQLSRNLLENSSLRRDRTVVMAPFSELEATSLTAVAKKEEALWKLLFYVGALRVSHSGGRVDPMWTMEVSSPCAASQLFSKYPPYNKADNTRDKHLRSLLERNPYPMMNFFSTRLSFTPISDLHRMTEAVFQEMFNSYFLDPELGYLGNYFSQLGLLTNAAQPASATGRQYGNRSTGNGKGKEVLPGLGRFGYMDSFGCSFEDLHPGRAVALELKNISLHGIFRAMYKDDAECSKAVNGIPGKDPADHFRKTCLNKIEELDKMSMAQLLQLRYHFYDGKTPIVRPVSALLAEAEVQLKSYVNAIARGEATNGKEGITNAEKRVRVTKNTDVPPDEVIGFVVCAVGQRIITIPVEPDIQNTQYQYSERRGWKTNWH